MSTIPKERGLRGFDLPIIIARGLLVNHYSGNGKAPRLRFPTAVEDWHGVLLTLREKAMIAITDKPDWHKKVYNEAIIAKWRVERETLAAQTPENCLLTEKMFDVCIDELRDYAQSFEKNGSVPAILAAATVYKSDTRISVDLRESLKAAVAPLENVPESQKDWHPDSDDKVLDLVHPSLFPLIYGRSTVLPDGNVGFIDADQYIGQGEVHPPQNGFQNPILRSYLDRSYLDSGIHSYSERFQWLPCEVKFTGESESRISSYINNLHPRHHRDLYECLERIIAQIVPMWDATLSSLGRMETTDQFRRRIQTEEPEWMPTEQRVPGPEEKDMDENDVRELDENWEREHRHCYPDPRQYDIWKKGLDRANQRVSAIDLRKDFAEQGIQVIVKLANIHLTPEKPDYAGGSWHIEGQLNEHIAASAIYYYDNDNIGESNLGFRETIYLNDIDEMPYEQGDFEHFKHYFGIENDDDPIHFLGEVLTRQDRVITFPNVLQHRVAPFSLQDRSKSGHRKILALFLVDPYIRIPSTAHVPPQQKHWWRDVVYGFDRINRLPAEITEQIMDSVDGVPFALEEAKEIRLELMDERRQYVKDVDEHISSESYSFCEH